MPDREIRINQGETVPIEFCGFNYPELIDGHVATTDIVITIYDTPIMPYTVCGWIAPAIQVPPSAETASIVAFNKSRVVAPFVLPIQSIPNRRKSIWPGTYAQYTATPEYRRIVAQAMKDWGYRCLMNVNHEGPVEGHHRSYANVPFMEDWRDLIPLCEDCHRRYHARLPKPPIGLFDLDDMEQEIKRAA